MKTSALYTLSFSVYVAVSIFSFCLYGSMPALLAKAQMPPQTFGYVYLALLPFMISFFYAGFVEEARKKSPSAFKFIVVSVQCALSACFVILAFLDIREDFYSIIAIFTLMSMLSSIVIIALNGVGIENSTSAQKATLNTIMLVASGLGGVLGVIVCLILCEWFGFEIAMLVMAVAILIVALPLFTLRYPLQASSERQSIFATLKNQSNWKGIGVLILLIFPLTLTISTNSALFVYLGFDLDIVGILSGVINCLTLLLASPLVYLLIQRLGFFNALRVVLLFEFVLFAAMAVNMATLQSHLLIVCGLFLISFCFGGQFVFCYTLGMRWCENSQQSGVDFSFLRMSENAAFILAGMLASQILGIFIQNFESLGSHFSIPMEHFFSHLLTHQGVAAEVGIGYMSIFTLSAVCVILSLIFSKHIKETL